MSGIIHFTSGKVLEITDDEMRSIAPRLKNGGIRICTVGIGHLIPLNSNTMEMIELVVEPENEILVENSEEIIEDKNDVIEKEKTPQEKQDDAMKELLAKSNCKHENTVLYKQHTAKGIRYFPVCPFCGKRERYVSEKRIMDGEIIDWTPEDIKNAKTWVEK